MGQQRADEIWVILVPLVLVGDTTVLSGCSGPGNLALDRPVRIDLVTTIPACSTTSDSISFKYTMIQGIKNTFAK